MNRGRLRKYAEIKRPTYETISGQSTITGYEVFSGIFLIDDNVTGSERDGEAQDYTSEEIYTMTCSYVEGIKHDDVLEMDGVVYDIITIWPRFEKNIVRLTVKLKDNYDG